MFWVVGVRGSPGVGSGWGVAEASNCCVVILLGCTEGPGLKSQSSILGELFAEQQWFPVRDLNNYDYKNWKFFKKRQYLGCIIQICYTTAAFLLAALSHASFKVILKNNHCIIFSSFSCDLFHGLSNHWPMKCLIILSPFAMVFVIRNLIA